MKLNNTTSFIGILILYAGASTLIAVRQRQNRNFWKEQYETYCPIYDGLYVKGFVRSSFIAHTMTDFRKPDTVWLHFEDSGIVRLSMFDEQGRPETLIISNNKQ